MPLRRRAVVSMVVTVAAALILTGCDSPHKAAVHVEPEVNFALPPASAGCGGAVALAGGAARLPITVSSVQGQVAELINVCIDGSGPYPFVIDSGAGESIIDARLAARLHLARVGSPTQFDGVGCTGTSRPVSVATWSAAGTPLAAQTLTAATLPDFGTKGLPVGLLGSDVLSRFGAVRIDFAARTLTLGGPEGPAITTTTDVRGPTGPAVPAVLTQGETGTTVPLTVQLAPGDTSLSVKVRLGTGRPHDFVVDTGSSQSVVDSELAKSSHLASSNLAQRQSTVCSTITAPLIHSGPWSVPGVALKPQLLGSTDFGPISAGGTAGLLGSDQLLHFGWVIFDYSGGLMVLG
jgi:hypothetical protein